MTIICLSLHVTTERSYTHHSFCLPHELSPTGANLTALASTRQRQVRPVSKPSLGSNDKALPHTSWTGDTGQHSITVRLNTRESPAARPFHVDQATRAVFSIMAVKFRSQSHKDASAAAAHADRWGVEMQDHVLHSDICLWVCEPAWQGCKNGERFHRFLFFISNKCALQSPETKSLRDQMSKGENTKTPTWCICSRESMHIQQGPKSLGLSMSQTIARAVQ